MNRYIHFGTMIKSMQRNLLFTCINIFGFAISLTIALLLGAYIYHELNVDSWNPNKDRIYIFTLKNHSYAPPALGPELAAHFPEMKTYTRLFQDKTICQTEGRKHHITYTSCDSTFFEIFPFRLIVGDSKKILRDGNSDVVISKKFALSTFGTVDVVGKTLSLKKSQHSDINSQPDNTYTISGVADDFDNSILHPTDILINLNTIGKLWTEKFSQGWDYDNHFTVFLAPEGYDLSARDSIYYNYLKDFYDGFKEKPAASLKDELHLVALKDAHFSPSVYIHRCTTAGGSLQYIYILMAVTLLIIVFAVVNYINLTIAQGAVRGKELATRRLLGASRTQLFVNLIAESILLCLIAFFVSILLAHSLSEDFTSLLQMQGSLWQGLPPHFYLLALLLILLLGIISGIFPALIITNFTPLDVVKGDFVRHTRQIYSKLLIGFQYAITLVLLTCSFIIISQTRFLKGQNPGFNKEKVIYCIQRNTGFSPRNIRNEMSKIPGVSSVCLQSGAGTVLSFGNIASFYDDNQEMITLQLFNADTAVFKVFDFRIVRRFSSDTTRCTGTFINESLYRRFNLKDGENTVFINKGREDQQSFTFDGVINDFNFAQDSRMPDCQTLFTVYDKDDKGDSFFIRYTGDDYQTMQQVKQAFTKVTGGLEFEGGFLNRAVDSWYDKQERTGNIISVMSLLAIVIATLGILAMSSYYIEQRRGEIAIRKIYGSETRAIISRFTTHFAWMIIGAFCLAAPLSLIIMNRWLSQFSSHITISALYIIIPLLITLTVAISIIYALSRRAAQRNPIESLKSSAR